MTLAMAAHTTTALVIVMLVAVVAVSLVMLLMAVLMITYLLPRRWRPSCSETPRL